MKNLIYSLSLSLIFFSCSDDDAPQPQDIHYNAYLEGAAMIPPNSAPGFGMFTGRYEVSTGKFGFLLTVQDMLTPTIATMHKTATIDTLNATTGPVIHQLTQLSPTTYGDTLTITQGMADSIALGYYYLQVASDGFPVGEIRGRIKKD